MICGTCKQVTRRTRTMIADKGELVESCDRCGDVGKVCVPDIFWPGHAYKSENITDRMGNPIELRSRGHKAEVMKKMGIIEMGDPVHGTREGNYNYGYQSPSDGFKQQWEQRKQERARKRRR